MSWLKVSGVTSRRPGCAEWQSRQEFAACPNARHAPNRMHPAGPAKRAAMNGRNLLRKEAIDTHTYHVNKSKDGEPGDPRFGAFGPVALKERQQQPQQAGQAATKNTQNLPVDNPDF